MRDKVKSSSGSHGGGNAVYLLGLIGAAVYYLQQASSFWMGVVAIFKAIVWPAFVVNSLMKFLEM